MDKEKQAILDKILKDKERGVRIIPGPGYRDKMQTIRSTSLDQLHPLLPITRAVGIWADQ